MTKPLHFKIETGDAYAAAFAKTCTPRPTRRGVILTGTCPRCEDPMDFPVLTRAFQLPVAAVPATKLEPLMCTCLITHPGAPPDEEGCGAYWNVELSEQAP